MLLLSLSWLVLLDVGLCSSALVLHETLDVYSTWERLGRVDPNQVFRMQIALKQSNIENAEDIIMDVSDPLSSNYGKYYTVDEINDLFAPSEESITTLTSWLLHNDIGENEFTLSKNRLWLSFDMSASEAEDLLATKYYIFGNGSGAESVACDAYYLPENVHGYIDFVLPGVQLVSTSKTPKQPPPPPLQGVPKTCSIHGLGKCDTCMTPECIASLYKVPSPTYKQPRPDNQLGIYENLDELYYPDVYTFFGKFAPQIPNGTLVNLVVYDGTESEAVTLSSRDSGTETVLDLDVAWPLIYPQNITLINDPTDTSKDPNDNAFTRLLDAFDGSFCSKRQRGKGRECGTIEPPNVVSISYSYDEFKVSLKVQERQCMEFMKLGLRGISVLLSSGDSGVESREGTCLGGGRIFSPMSPACPYITMVGGTEPVANHSVLKPGFERTWANIERGGFFQASSGGFSNIFKRPRYQDAAVTSFLKNHDPGYLYYELSGENGSNFTSKYPPGSGIYNRIGRAYPDVSAMAFDVLIFKEYEAFNVPKGYYFSGGTSSATPIWSAIINRITEQRLAAGKSTLGFLNPVLYQNPQVLNDITVGHTVGCNTTGFHAAEGWDAATGLGSPIYPKLLALFMSLP